MPAIDVRQLTKIYPVAIKQPGLAGTVRHFFQRDYRQVKAVNEVSFSIEPGEVVGFLGPNGAGKTTTLKMLTGLIYPSSGDVKVAGHIPFQRQRSFLEQITLVMGQKQQLIWDLPALDSLRINGAIYDLPTQELRQRIYELAEMLDIADKLTQPVRKLSLGERMKAEMLAALLHRPKVLFLDEPTLGLDVNAQMAVRKFLQTYNQRYQATIVLTSHYMADITALCDRVLLIYQGQLIYDGSLDKLVEQFAPYREVTADLAAEVSAEVLGAYGEIQSLEGCKVVLLVRREDLTKTVSQALAQLPVNDLTVTDPPIEDVIGRVFDAGSV
ncbi:MAG: ATP-binding cassette domain-containing protein [Cyanobacteria bacterium P01_D01_bin.56]